MKCSTPQCQANATLQLLGNHPICRACGDEKNRKSRIRSAKRRAEGLHSPAIQARWSDKKRARMLDSRPIDLDKITRTVIRRQRTNNTARLRLGDPVRTVEQLAKMAEQKRSVFYDGCWGLLPAIVVMNMAASRVHSAIKSGRLYVYLKPKEAK